MVFNALQINSYVFSEEIGANAKKNPFGRLKFNTLSLAAAECELSVDHWPSSGDVWVRACNVCLPQCPS